MAILAVRSRKHAIWQPNVPTKHLVDVADGHLGRFLADTGRALGEVVVARPDGRRLRCAGRFPGDAGGCVLDMGRYARDRVAGAALVCASGMEAMPRRQIVHWQDASGAL